MMMEKMKVLQILMAVSIMATVTPRTVFGTIGRSTKLRIGHKVLHPDQSSSGISEDAPSSPNGNGCSSVPNNCDALCLKIDASGCIICTCSGTEANRSSSGLSSGSLTGSAIKLPHSAAMNLNGCPPFPAGCPGDCASLDSNGCAICKCPVSGGSGGSTGGMDNSTSVSVVAVDNGYNHVDSGATNNGNGCPPYSKDCQAECAAIDEHGCVVCQCTTSGSGSSGGSDNSTSVSVGGGGVVNAYNHISSGAMNNGNGCPAYSKDCPAECAAIDDRGCVVCRCTISGTPGANGTSTTGAGGGDTTNIAFHNEYNHLSPGSSNNNNNCPQFSESCPAECTTTNDDGCPVCSCILSGNTGGGSTSGGSAPATIVHECPVFDTSCPVTCTTVDGKQCLICTCSNVDTTTTIHKTTPAPTVSTTTTSPVTSACPVFYTSCPQACTSLDEMQCLICTCADIATTTVLYKTTTAQTVLTTTAAVITSACPVFDASCPSSCISLDEMQCLTCTCADITTTPAPTVPTTTTSPVTKSCPVFDASCPQACISLDEMQCLQCTCADITTTPAPTVPTTTTSPVTKSCPVFDASCPQACISLDEMQCLQCTCAASTATTTTTVATTPILPFGNVNKCPPFDASCPVNCASVDVKGCLICTCSGGTTAAQQPTTVPPTTSKPLSQVGLGNGCPPFDANCDPACTTINVQGCMTCTCAAASSPSTTNPTTTTAASATCPPLRCVYPCDLGVTIGADKCPICKCRTVTTTKTP